MDLIANLIPETKIVNVKDRIYEIKKLSIKQVLLLTKFLFHNIYQNKEKFAVFSGRIAEQDNKNNLQDILAIIDLLDESQIYYLIGILINEQDLKFIEENIDFDLCISIVSDLVELNQKSNVKKNIQKMFQLMSESQKSEAIKN
jgi:hypothetical protein